MMTAQKPRNCPFAPPMPRYVSAKGCVFQFLNPMTLSTAGDRCAKL